MFLVLQEWFQSPSSPIKALHSDEELLAGAREVSTTVPVEPVDVGHVGVGQLLCELCSAAGAVPPLVADLVLWSLWLRAGQLLVFVTLETLIYRCGVSVS